MKNTTHVVVNTLFHARFVLSHKAKESMVIYMEYHELYAMRIRQLCKKRGIAINKLATMSGVRQSTIDNIVRGLTKSPGVRTLHKIAIAFNMTLAEFLDFGELNEYSFDDEEID